MGKMNILRNSFLYIQEGGIYNFQWQIFMHLHLTPLGRSFKVKLFLVRPLTQGRVRHKNISVLWCRQQGETAKYLHFHSRMTFLSRSNKERRLFKFATEEFKCRLLYSFPGDISGTLAGPDSGIRTFY